jgi:tetratricopeptide (TPR) repeat protein
LLWKPYVSGELLTALLLIAALEAGCRPRLCQELSDRKDHASAAAICVHSFEHTGDPNDGIAAAQALAALHRDDEVLAVLSSLLSGTRGPDARRLMATIYIKREQYAAAEHWLRDVLELDRQRNDHARESADLTSLATVARNRDDFAEALKLATLAVAEADASGDRELRASTRIARGDVLQAAGDYERALEAYATATAQLPPGDSKDRARVLILRAVLLNEQRQYALARPLLDEARTLAADASEPSLVLGAEVNLADIAIALHHFDAAARHLDGAEAAWKASGRKIASPGILFNRVILARQRGDLAAATSTLDALAATGPSPDVAWLIAHERGLTAYAGGNMDAAERYYSAAIDTVETMWRSARSEELKAPFFEDRWLPYQSLFALQLERGALDSAFGTLVSAQGRMFLAEATTASAGASIERRNRLRSLAPLIAASPISRSLAPKQTLDALREHYVLNYFAAAGRMRLVIIDHGELRSTSVGIALPDLDKLVDDFVANVDDGAAARALGEALLPAEALRSAPKRLHVIPDGALQRVPFAALIADGARLIERYDIVYSPSATGLASLTTTASTSTAPAVLLGDPQRNLEYGAEEARTVVAQTHATPRTGGEATIAALRAADDASLLHIIGHSGIDADGGYLILADGHVSAAQIVTWRLHPHVVVLPTCASAATNRRDMWGSLAVGFLAAGSIDVVSTLVSVEDSRAAEFTREFYRHDGAGDPVAATAAAQRALRKQGAASAWSAFIVVGL